MLGEYTRSIGLYERALAAEGEQASSREWEFARNIAAAYSKLGNKPKSDEWRLISDTYKAAAK